MYITYAKVIYPTSLKSITFRTSNVIYICLKVYFLLEKNKNKTSLLELYKYAEKRLKNGMFIF